MNINESGTYDMVLVFVSYVIAVVGSYVSLMLLGKVTDLRKNGDRMWLGFAAVVLAGVAIWSMHFIGMIAYKMPMPVSYDPLLTAASMAIAIVLTAVGFSMVTSKKEVAFTRLAGAGTVMGLGVAAMHYLGMQGMTMSGVMQHNFTIVGISIVIAIVASIAALWIAVNMRQAWQKVISAFVMGVAVCGMHYTAMSGVSFAHSGDVMSLPASGIENDFLAVYVMAAAGLISLAALAAIFIGDASEEV